MKDDHHSHKPIIPWYFWAIAAGLVILWSTTVPVVKWMGFGSPDGAGTFGDTFGALNALFLGLAFLGVLASIFIQGREFRSQLEEMRTTATEMEKQSKIHDAQLETWRLQNELFRRQLCEAQIQERVSAEPFLKLEVMCVADGENLSISVYLVNYTEVVFGVTLRASFAGKCGSHPVVKPNTNYFGFDSKIAQDSPQVQGAEFICEYTTRLGHTQIQHFPCILVSKPGEVTTLQTDMSLIAKEIRAQVEQVQNMSL